MSEARPRPRCVGRIGSIALAFLTGCFGLGVPDDLSRSALGTRASVEERARVGSWLVRERAARGERTSLRAYARVRIQAELGKARVREVIAAERPARLRVETINFFGQAQSLLVADGERSALVEGGQVLESVVPGELLVRLGLDLTPAEAIDLLLATPAVPEVAPRSVWVAGESFIAEYPTRRVRLDRGGAVRAVEAREPTGELRWIVEFDAWSDVAGGRYPLEIRAYFPLTDLRAEFVMEDVELNAELDAGLFECSICAND